MDNLQLIRNLNKRKRECNVSIIIYEVTHYLCSITYTLPPCTAWWMGPFPLWSTSFMLALFWSSKFIISTSPRLQAKWKGVSLKSFSAFGSALYARSKSTTCMLHVITALWRGVWPLKPKDVGTKCFYICTISSSTLNTTFYPFHSYCFRNVLK